MAVSSKPAKRDDSKASRVGAKDSEEAKSNHTFVFPAIYASILCVFYLAYRVYPGPEFLVLCFFIYAAYNKWSRRFVKDWVPFVTFFLSYQLMNGFVGDMSRIVHVGEPINADLRLFGSVPTLVLQQFYRSAFLDYAGALFYSLHFIAPAIFAFVLWKYESKDYWKYTLAFAICTYSALVTFLIYPVAPPWFGVNATRILFQVDNRLGVPLYRTLFDYIQPNPFAAFPSLHAAYPWLISLFALKIGKKKALPILVFPAFVWFGAVYLGEHYVVDVVGGIIYATVAFLLAEKLVPQLSRFAHQRGFIGNALYGALGDASPLLGGSIPVLIACVKWQKTDL
jgi:membrane-associated phospholipid phosphatase